MQIRINISDLYRLPYHGYAAAFLLESRVSEFFAIISNQIEAMYGDRFMQITPFEHEAVQEAQSILRTQLQKPPI